MKTKNLKTSFVLSSLFLTLTACSHAWVVSQQPDGGVIAVEGNPSADVISQYILEYSPCFDYKVLSQNDKASAYKLMPTPVGPNRNSSPMFTIVNEDLSSKVGFDPKPMSLNTSGMKTWNWKEITYSCAQAHNFNPANRYPASDDIDDFRLKSAWWYGPRSVNK